MNFAFVEQKVVAEQKKPLNARPLMELREILRERGLPTSDNKCELAARLFEAEPKLEQCVPMGSESSWANTPEVMGAQADAKVVGKRKRAVTKGTRIVGTRKTILAERICIAI